MKSSPAPAIAPRPAHHFQTSWQAELAPATLGYRLKLLSQLLTRRFQEQLAPFDLTPFHWVVLCCLWETDGLPTSTLGEKLQQVGGTMTGVLDRMEERELITRQRDRHDRRIWRIWLTPQGKHLQTILPAIARNLSDTALSNISPSDRDRLSALIDQMIDNLT